MSIFEKIPILNKLSKPKEVNPYLNLTEAELQEKMLSWHKMKIKQIY